MYTILLIFHTICCILLVAVVLLQVGRGRGMMGFLGGGGADSLFGSRTGDVLTKSTTAVAILFMVTSLSLAYISMKKGGSVMKGISPRPGVTPTGEEVVPETLPIVQKGASLVEKFKQKLGEKIPRLTKEEPKKEELVPSVTTKSKIRYDEKGNKIVDELKYDPQGSLIGHSEITYDRLGKETDRKELPLVEKEEPEETSVQSLPKE